MTGPIIALEGAKRGKQAGNALLGDIYTRRWTTKRGKHKGVEHEVKVNPVSLGLGALAIGAAGVCGATALWALQLRAAPRTEAFVYGKWVWPDGTDASVVKLEANKGLAPWKYVRAPNPDPTVIEWERVYAVWTVTETQTQTRIGIAQRRGFSVLGGDQPLPDVDDTAKFILPWVVSPVAGVLQLIRK